jgi:uncharacterized protein
MIKINFLKEFVDDGVRFECVAGCTKCCAIPGMVFVKSDEIPRIADFFKMTKEGFTKKYLHRHWADVYNLDFPDTEPCIFLKEDGCAIYEVRPSQCRTFPFWPENMSNPKVWRDLEKLCPGIGEGKTYKIDEIVKIMIDVCFGPFL